ncbi:MAG: tRNA adenosine(34) deaminase TadA [Candidatus Aminicenantia bacterium]
MNDHGRWIKAAIKEAEKAYKKGEVPVGAIAVMNGTLIAKAHNSSISLSDPTAHAEILVLRKAGKKIGNYRLNELTIYSTLEPCLMCFSAMVHARIKRLVFGAEDPKTGFSIHSISEKNLNHKIEIKGGILREECSIILKKFFSERRGTEVVITGPTRNRLS